MSETVKHLLKALVSFFLLLFAHKGGYYFYESAFAIFLFQLWIAASLLATVVFIGKAVKINLFFPIALVALIELFFILSFHIVSSGTRLTEPFIVFLKQLYFERCRNVCFDDELSFRYDSTLFYTLPPGRHRFSNLEFKTNYEVNNLGFRDDEAALANPEIVFLGDSHTMGWGVEKAETFEALIENELHKKCLNTGIASYGTAREFLTLERLDLTGCKLLVLQFCKNDTTENRSFVAHGNFLPISDKKKLESSGKWNQLWKSYFPLKYCYASFFQGCNNAISACSAKKPPPLPYKMNDEEVADFFKIILLIKEKFDGNILVFNLNEQNEPSTIYDQFQHYLRSNPMDKLHLLNPDADLTPDDYFIIDDHLNAKGHRKLASQLGAYILENRLAD